MKRKNKLFPSEKPTLPQALREEIRRIQNQPPLFTTGFALSKSDMEARLSALWDAAPKRRGLMPLLAAVVAAVFLGGLVACTQTRRNPDVAWVIEPTLPYADIQPLQFERDPYHFYEGETPDYNMSKGLVAGGGFSWLMQTDGETNLIGLIDSDGSVLVEPRAFSGMGIGDGGFIYFAENGYQNGYVLDENYQLQPIDQSGLLGISGTAANEPICWVEDEQAFHRGPAEGGFLEPDAMPGNPGPVAVQAFTTVPENGDLSPYLDPPTWNNFGQLVSGTIQYWTICPGIVLTDGTKPVSDVYYEYAGAYNSGVFPVQLNGKWGYADRNGELVIPCEYEQSAWGASRMSYLYFHSFCYPATEGTVVLCKGEQYALYSTAGEELIPFGQFEVLRPVQNGRLWARQNGLWGLLALPEGYATPDTDARAPTLRTVSGGEPSDEGRIPAAIALENAVGAWERSYRGNAQYDIVEYKAAHVIPWEEMNEEQRELFTDLELMQSYETTDAHLVRVDFSLRYKAEVTYLGPQYSDGDGCLYYLATKDGAVPCSGWCQDDPQRWTGYLPHDVDEMVWRQAQALYAAGITDFDGVAALTHDDLGRYLTARGKDFLQEGNWLAQTYNDQQKSLILCVDFTGEENVWTAWPQAGETLSFTEQEAAAYSAAPQPAALEWHWDGRDTVTGYNGGDAVVEYKMGLFPGGDRPWTARSYVLSGRSLPQR